MQIPPQRWLASSLLVLLIMAGVKPVAAQPASSTSPPALTNIAVRAINTLGLELLRRVDGREAGALLSPYSIQTALAMTYAGAEGVTREQMSRVLHLPDDAGVDESFAALRKALEAAAERTVEKRKGRGEGERRAADPLRLTVANRLFGQQGYEFRAPFVQRLRDTYEAPLEAIDFTRNWNAAREHINAWVSEQTGERIQDLIPSGGLNRDTRLVLVNAIYMKAPWAEPFMTNVTQPAPFHLPEGEPVSVPTMQRVGTMGHARRDGFTAVTLPYRGGEVQFLILLPEANQTLQQLEAALTPEVLESCSRLPNAEVKLHLPRFRMEPPLMTLARDLAALGMPSAFDEPAGSADFSRMAERKPSEYLRISEVFHKTFLELDEQGTEAAAATAVSMIRVTSIRGPAPSPVEVRVDRPFLFAIQHRATGACLFLGRLVDPR